MYDVIYICSEIVVKQYLSINLQSLSFNRLNFNIYFYYVATLGGGPNNRKKNLWQGVGGCFRVQNEEKMRSYVKDKSVS